MRVYVLEDSDECDEGEHARAKDVRIHLALRANGGVFRIHLASSAARRAR
jgi:hypothetical protein